MKELIIDKYIDIASKHSPERILGFDLRKKADRVACKQHFLCFGNEEILASYEALLLEIN